VFSQTDEIQTGRKRVLRIDVKNQVAVLLQLDSVESIK
jgi:hypothetical protein